MSTSAAIRLALALPLALPLALGFGALACTSDDGNDEHSHDEHSHDEHDDEHDDTHGETHGSDCEEETRDDEYMVGLSKSGDSVTVSFVTADPAPPALGDNTWTVTLSEPDASITAVTPFMPDHDHGTPVEAIVTATANPGEFEISPVNLFMAGLWEVTLDISTEAGTPEQVVFAFCVE
ncbi:MAG: FixH family protein [Enhygromyxa sp.]